MEQTMATSFYLASRLRKYAHMNQFGAKDPNMKDAINRLMDKADRVFGSKIKGTLASDVLGVMDHGEADNLIYKETDDSQDGAAD
jgi:hypothetical protein